MGITHDRIEFLRGKEGFRVVRKILHDRRGELDFTSTLSDSLAHFECGETSEFFLFFPKYLSGPSMILERSLKGRPAQLRKALSALDNASITWLSVCSAKVLSTSPVAGLTLR